MREGIKHSIGTTLWPWAVTAALCTFAGAADAVDVVNRDKVPREIVVNENNGGSRVLTVRAKEKVAQVCTACVILMGESSVEANGNMTVMVEGGKVSIGSKR